MNCPLELRLYLVKAVHDFCLDSGIKPLMAVKLSELSLLPADYLKNDEIIFNLGNAAVRELQWDFDNFQMSFCANFEHTPRDVLVATADILWIGTPTREIGVGFDLLPLTEDKPNKITKGGLRLV